MKTGIMGILVYCITSAQMFTMHEHIVQVFAILKLEKIVLVQARSKQYLIGPAIANLSAGDLGAE